MAVSTHRLTGNLYLNSDGTGIINADGAGLLSDSVKFDSINRGTPGYVALYKSAAPNAGVLTGGIPKSTAPLAGALVEWDGTGKIDGVTINGGNISATTITATTVNSDSVVINVPPTLPDQAATVQYVNDAIATVVGGFNWQELVIDFESDPALLTPADGDRYVALATIGPWTNNNIYEWNAGTASWDETVAVDGMAVTSLQGDPVTPVGGPASYIYTAGTGWLLIGFNGMHDNLVGKKNTNSVSSDTALVAAASTNAVVYSWATTTDRVWTGRIELVGASNGAAGHAHFSWRVAVQNHAGVATFSISNTETSVSGNLATAVPSLAIKAAPDDEFLDIRITTPALVTSYWHATIEGTFVPIVVP